MTAPRVTSCPHCNTSFRITQAQLRAANGSVRCGSCLQVFDAKPNTAGEKPPKPAQSKVTKPDSEPFVSNEASATPASAPAVKPKQKAEPVSSVAEMSIQKANPAPEPEPEQDFSKAIRELDEKEERESRLIRGHRKQHYLWNLWTAGAAFFVLTFLFQYAWFNKDTLSLNPGLRPAYEWLCKTINCPLPPQVDVTSIKSLQLMVRSHPDHPNALVVDAVIINDASHTQPYPVIDLLFTDINGNLVANREFLAQEYLAGELAGAKKMPIGQPIRLALEIIDPGQDAVNYRFTFSPDKRL